MAQETPHTPGPNMSWREYQARLKKSGERKRLALFALKWLALLAAGTALLMALVLGGLKLAPRLVKKETLPPAQMWSKEQVRDLLADQRLWLVAEEPRPAGKDGSEYETTTTLDLEFQRHMLKAFDVTNARAIAFVAMDPATGKVLVMAGHHRDAQAGNPCTQVLFPAASVFKMVTAAAALETLGYSPSTQTPYNGKKHTLYKSQLTDQDNKWTRRIPFKEAFADSINPVFGKMGIKLGGEALKARALAFGFSRDLPFECPLAPSVVHEPGDDYALAELASGFNRNTTLTALHGALLAGAAVNGGILYEPTIVAAVENKEGVLVYQGHAVEVGRAASEQACNALRDMMVAAAVQGTGSGAFGNGKRGKVLKKVIVGGKTGSINNDTQYDIRYDWFVGFAMDLKGRKKLAVSCVVAHEKFIGPKAMEYSKTAIEYYFD